MQGLAGALEKAREGDWCAGKAGRDRLATLDISENNVGGFPETFTLVQLVRSHDWERSQKRGEKEGRDGFCACIHAGRLTGRKGGGEADGGRDKWLEQARNRGK